MCLSKDEDAAVGLPIMPSLIGVSLKMSNPFVVSKLVISNKLDAKFGSPDKSQYHEMLGRPL